MAWRAALNGVNVLYSVQSHFAAGRLLPVLRDLRLAPAQIFLRYACQRNVLALLQALIRDCVGKE